MGAAANCRTFCPSAHNNQIEIIGPIKAIELHEVSLEPVSKQSELSLTGEVAAKRSDAFLELMTPEKECKASKPQESDYPWKGAEESTERPSLVEPSYVQNRIVVPSSIIQGKLSEAIRLLIRKELPKNALLDETATWYLLPSGNYYSGEMKDGVPTEQGTYLFGVDRVSVYSGCTSDGKPDGMGVLIDEYSVYKGEFFKGEARGKGRYQTSEIIAEGTWSSGQMAHGRINSQKYNYQGEFIQGKPSGQGTYKDLQRGVTYTGKFVDGKFDCFSSCPNRNNNKEDPRNCQTTYRCRDFEYEGPFKDGKRHGEGTMRYRQNEHQEVKLGSWRADRFQSK